MNLSALGPFFRYARTKQPTPGTQDLGFEPIWAQLLHRISGAGVPYPQKYQPVACGCKGVVGPTPYLKAGGATHFYTEDVFNPLQPAQAYYPAPMGPTDGYGGVYAGQIFTQPLLISSAEIIPTSQTV